MPLDVTPIFHQLQNFLCVEQFKSAESRECFSYVNLGDYKKNNKGYFYSLTYYEENGTDTLSYTY